MQFRVWAPRAGRVELQLRGERLDMAAADGGWWEREASAAAGADYGYRLDGGDPLPDPRSRWQPDGVHGLSRIVDHSAFRWTDRAWRGRRLADVVVYEMHTGTFTTRGTFASAIERLDHLVELGVEAVEVMPVAEFAGDRGWGYDGVDLWAPHHAYGGPDGLKALVDACHARGLAVVLDVVYNHLGPEGSYLERFGPYLTSRYRTPWGQAVNYDGRDSRPVRDFVVDNAVAWLRDYHLDGLRLDAVHAIFDSSRPHILEELAARVHELDPPRFVVAEKPRVDPSLLAMGLDGQWADDLHHSLHVLLTGERTGYYAPYGTVDDLASALLDPGRLGVSLARLVGFSQNHDQVGNRATGDRLSQLVDADRLRLAAAVVLCSPMVPMVFMGEEWGASTPFLFFSDHRDPTIARATSRGRIEEFQAFGWRAEDVPDPQVPATFERSRLDWSELEREPHRGLLAWYRRLLALRRSTPELRAGGPLSVEHSDAGRRLVMSRDPVRVQCDFEAGRVVVEKLGKPLEWE
ncbi:MAG TPA: malto-oligosyltrehalose trehalohydrolase [Terriglobales bacterium]|nr:malto-oligosyltrehalose trehalohydrolase [Terriglobales bacterium]